MGSQKARSDRGAVAVVVAVFAIVAMILLAFVVDRGRIYVQRAQLQNAVDAAALAAVQETCANPIAAAGSVRTVAIDYAAQNDITVDPTNVIVQDGVDDATTGVSVAAERSVSSVFGGFAGVGDSVVAARGTATRLCRERFQYVADEDFNFNGTGTDVQGSIYAGQCFDGNGGRYFGTVAVSKPDTFDCGNPHNYPIYNGNLQENGTNCPDDINACEYDVVGVTAAGAIATAGFDIGAIDLLPLTHSDCDDVDAADFGSAIVCEGNLEVPNGATVRYNVIVRDGDYDDDAATQYDDSAGQFLVYSDTGRIILNSNEDIPSLVYFYAPTPTSQSNQYSITYSGGGQDMDGNFIGYDIRNNGGGGSGSSGVNIRIAGPWRLSQ